MKNVAILVLSAMFCLLIYFLFFFTDEGIESKFQTYLDKHVFPQEKIIIKSIHKIDDKFIEKDVWLNGKLKELKPIHSSIQACWNNVNKSPSVEVENINIDLIRNNIKLLSSQLETLEPANLERIELTLSILQSSFMDLKLSFSREDQNSIHKLEQIIDKIKIMLGIISSINARFRAYFIHNVSDYLKYRRFESNEEVPYILKFQFQSKKTDSLVLLYNVEDRRVTNYSFISKSNN